MNDEYENNYEYEYENTFVESTVKAGGVGVTMTKRVKRYLPLTPLQPFKFRTSSAPQPPKTSALPVTISQTLDTSKTTRRPNHRGFSAATVARSSGPQPFMRSSKA